MSGISNINSSLYLGANAIQVHSTGMQVTAHNIANVNTAKFEPQRALLATGPNGYGVELDAVIREKRPGGGLAEPSDNDDLQANGMPLEFLEPSGTELARELPHMISTQHAFEANTRTITAVDEMMGTLLNIKA